MSINVAAYDAYKHGALNLVSDAKVALLALTAALGGKTWSSDSNLRTAWARETAKVKAAPKNNGLPTDSQVIGAVQRTATLQTVVISPNRWEEGQITNPSRVQGIKMRDVAFQNPQTAADLLGGSGYVFIQKSHSLETII